MISEKDLEEIRIERDGLRSDVDEKIEKMREDIDDFLKMFNKKASVIREMISCLYWQSSIAKRFRG